MEKTTQVSMKGMSTRPASVALEPRTDCMYRGTKEITPNIAMPEKSPEPWAARNMRMAKSLRGTRGCSAFSSMRTYRKIRSRNVRKRNEPAKRLCWTMDSPRRSEAADIVKSAVPTTSRDARPASRGSSFLRPMAMRRMDRSPNGIFT
ncbi:MAG: hypothetical protein A2902_03590 [Elusimicrobia bacterium RIFCSPLOWO2_01_FULL_64_13]|nr:MAG: hypothetical protein A2902_03590 [Elusimicrobia bacterium RIFCSPLOWO2_01_FULL_64_13]